MFSRYFNQMVFSQLTFCSIDYMFGHHFVHMGFSKLTICSKVPLVQLGLCLTDLSPLLQCVRRRAEVYLEREARSPLEIYCCCHCVARVTPSRGKAQMKTGGLPLGSGGRSKTLLVLWVAMGLGEPFLYVPIKTQELTSSNSVHTIPII